MLSARTIAVSIGQLDSAIAGYAVTDVNKKAVAANKLRPHHHATKEHTTLCELILSIMEYF